MSRIQLSTQKMRVIVGKYDDESTWREFEVQTINPDRLRAEAELSKRKLTGGLGDHGLLASTAIAFFALKRTGQIVDGTFADFEAGCLDIDLLEEEPVDPTHPAATPD